MMRTWLALACVLTAAGPLYALTADDVSKQTGLHGGLCVFPRATAADEALALELARKPSFVVQALSADAGQAARLRSSAESAGVLGRSLYVEQGSAAPLPLADRLADLIVVTDLRDADLTAELRAEWLGVLSPRRGAALVGRSRAAGDGLSEAALKAWTRDLPLAKVFADASGLWAVLRVDLPAGSDGWTHRCHGPENSQVSADTTFKGPFLAQWWGMPRQEGFWGTSVVAGNGRMFSLRGSRRSADPVVLTARSLTNGIVLWQRHLRPSDNAKTPHGGYVPGRSCIAVAGDSLYLIDRDGVLRLSAETGEQADRIPGPRPGGGVKWIACAGPAGPLAMLAGDADVIRPLSYQTVAANSFGRDLAVYDPDAKKVLWRDTAAGDIDERLIAVAGGKVYYLAQDVGVACRDLRTGKEAWTNGETEIQADFKPPPAKQIGGLLFSQPGLLAVDDVLVLRARWAKNMFVLSRDDGKTLWKRATSGGRALTSLAVNGLWLGGRSATDLKTGEPAKGPRFISSGCGPTTAAPGYLITCFGAVEDIGSNASIRPADIKSPCDVGSLVAEGMMVTVPSECSCNFEIKGYRVLASAGGIKPHAAPPWKDRLTVLDAAEPAALAVTDADWPTYRHDAQRSGATPAAVGGGPVKVLWHYKPADPPAGLATIGPSLAPDFLTTAPVTAAGRAWFASHDGVIRCVKADTGESLWTFPTAGRLFAPPTIWQGRVLAGGGDGRIYCLDATSGRRLWQFQAAPADRRVFWFGHLVGTWPVVGGVAVKDGVAYAVAGYQADSGIHAYALDAKTGQVRWETDDAGTGGAVGAGAAYSNAGQVALVGGRLWLCSSTAVPGSFDLATGQWKPQGKGGTFGCEIAGLGDKWVIHGGRRLSETQDTLGHPLRSAEFAARPTDAPAPRVALADNVSPPAWDGELCVLSAPRRGGLTGVPTAKLLDWMGQKPSADRPKTWADLKVWAAQSGPPAAYALAADQLVVAWEAPGRPGGPPHKLAAFSRADGSATWTVDLPAQPAMNRLAIDRDGRVLVGLCDGSMICVGR